MLLSILGKEEELIPLRTLADGTPYSQEYLILKARSSRCCKNWEKMVFFKKGG